MKTVVDSNGNKLFNVLDENPVLISMNYHLNIKSLSILIYWIL